jgi:hypothetical protein
VFVTSHGGVHSQFRRALEGGSFMQAWPLAAELPQVPLADGLSLLLLARDVEPARFDRAVLTARREGASLSGIATKLGISKQAVAKRLRNLGPLTLALILEPLVSMPDAPYC